MDKTTVDCTKVTICENDCEEKQNFNVILVPESVLVALSKSTTPVKDDESDISNHMHEDRCVLDSSNVDAGLNTIATKSLENPNEFHQNKDLPPGSGVIVLEDGEEWFVNIDFTKSLKESSQSSRDWKDATSDTLPVHHQSDLTKIQNLESSQGILNIRETQKTFKCTVFNCHRRFTTESDLKIHLENHDKQKIYQCHFPGCPWSFSTPYKLRRHASSHEQTKSFKCNHPGCDVSCSTKYNLKAHQQVHKPEDKSHCALCNISFNSKLQMLKHQRLKHEKEAVFSCSHENCDKKFHTIAARTTHLKTHQRTKIICWFDGCGKKFHKPASLREHVLSKHTKIRPYKCDYPDCCWEFTTNSKLKRHMVTHTGMKSWICPFEKCSSKFYRKEHLKSHLKIHSSNNKDKGKGLSDPDAPVELKFEDMVYYFCPYEDCGSLFASQIGAKQHIQKMHQTSNKSQIKSTKPPSIVEDETPSTSQALLSTVSKDVVCNGENTNEPCGDVGMTSDSILQALMQADISTVNQTSNSSTTLVTTQTSDPMRHYLSDPSKTGLPQDVPSLSAPSAIEASHFLVLNPRNMDFDVNDAPVVQDNIRYVNVTNTVFPVQTSTSPADQYFTFSGCVQTVDPNDVMAVQSPLQLPELTENGQNVNEGSESEDFDKQHDDTGGSARTDGDAYHKLKVRKQWRSASEGTSEISLEKTSPKHNQSMQEFFLHETGILPSDQLNEKMTTTCIAGHFEGSTINLGDLE